MSQKKILLIEDEAIIQSLCRRLLAKTGWELILAGTLGEAREKMKGPAVDLLITDLKLPDGDGVEIIRELRERFPKTKAMVITGSPSPESRLEKLTELGVTDIIFKPFEVEEFEKAVHKALEEAGN